MTRAQGQKPRLGFAGVGWIGLNRLEALRAADLAEIVACYDPNSEARVKAAKIPESLWVTSYEELLSRDLDGVVISTPSALHREQCLEALRQKKAVFCQKPLARDETETRQIVEAASQENLLLGCDLSYRYATAVLALRERLKAGAIGRPYAVDLVFHNAYGPDKPWYYEASQSGGGSVIDLGVHLVDLALWLLSFPELEKVSSRLYTQGKPWAPGQVEDYAEAQLGFAGGVVCRLSCSWRLHAGQDAVIEARVHGTEGGLAFRNLNGSFYDFVAEHYRGTRREALAMPPDEWGGKALLSWTQRLSCDSAFDFSAWELTCTASVLDAIYRGATW